MLLSEGNFATSRAYIDSNWVDGGINVGAFYTETKGTRATMWTYNGKNIGEETGTVFVQKTF